jgi:hypothetical protein
MGSKGDRQDGLAGVGVNRVPPGFARPRVDVGDRLDDRAAAGSLRTLLTIRRDEPVAASLGRSTVRRRRWSCAVLFRDSMQSAGCRARPPSSGRSTRQCRNVKRSRRPPGATRRVLSRWLTPTHHPEHGEAGRGQRLIAHTHTTPCRLPSVPQGTEGMPPRRGSFFLRWPTALLVGRDWLASWWRLCGRRIPNRSPAPPRSSSSSRDISRNDRPALGKVERTIQLVGRALQTGARARQRTQNAGGPAASLCR